MGDIELNAFLKMHGVGGTGGQARIIIRSGIVSVNGRTETRNKCKLNPGDVVIVEDKKFLVT